MTHLLQTEMISQSKSSNLNPNTISRMMFCFVLYTIQKQGGKGSWQITHEVDWKPVATGQME